MCSFKVFLKAVSFIESSYVFSAHTSPGCKEQVTLFVSDEYGTPICITASTSVRITCVITPPENIVIWYKDDTLQTSCSGLTDMCRPQSRNNARYNFTSNVAQKEFYFHLSSVQSTDSGLYTCEHQVNRETVTLSVCDDQQTTERTTGEWTTTVLTRSMGTSTAKMVDISEFSILASTIILEPSARTDDQTNTVTVSTLAAVAGAMGAVIVTQAIALVFVLIKQKKCIQLKGDEAYEMTKPSAQGNEERQYDVLY